MNVHVWYDRPVMDEPFTAVVDSPVQWIFNRTAMGGGDGAAHHLAISISGARDEVDVPRAELAEAMSAELAVLLPRARAARILDTAVVKEPQATFAQAPGQAARRPGTATPLPGVALAGAWTATGWPATMEGAVRSGIAAARHVMAPPGTRIGRAWDAHRPRGPGIRGHGPARSIGGGCMRPGRSARVPSLSWLTGAWPLSCDGRFPGRLHQRVDR